MILGFTVINHKDESLYIDLFKPELSGINVRKMDGLDPVKASIYSSDISSGDGQVYSNARKSTRTISITLGLTESPSIEECRRKVYKYFPTKKKIKLIFNTDHRVCYTYGYVEVPDVNIFEEDETVTISVVCLNPYFFDVTPANYNMSTLFNNFEFASTNSERRLVWCSDYSMLENNMPCLISPINQVKETPTTGNEGEVYFDWSQSSNPIGFFDSNGYHQCILIDSIDPENETVQKYKSTYGYIVCPECTTFSTDSFVNGGAEAYFTRFFLYSGNDLVEYSVKRSTKRYSQTKFIEFGYYDFTHMFTFQYPGEADTGVIMTMHATATVKEITIYKINTNEKMTIDTTKLKAGCMEKGDTLILCTVNGEKYCHLVKDGVVTNAIGCVARGSNWLQFLQGDNTFAYNAAEGDEYLFFNIEADTLYEGI